MIKREDMLELTRRLTSDRANLVRVAGAYMDSEGYVDGTFNTMFLKLKGKEKEHVLEIAKTVPFAKTNEELIQKKVPGMRPGSIWQLLYALRDCELKNDALLLTLYEFIGENHQPGKPYAVYVYYGCYDIINKAKDHTFLGESEEVYRYLIVTICPSDENQDTDLPYAGFLYPVLTDRSTDFSYVNVFSKDADPDIQGDMKKILGI